MEKFEPRHKFFIGIDSDGTVFDSMEIKQKRCFLPVAVEMWDLQPVQKEFYEIAEFINLYSVHRGLNRFAALAMAFEMLAKQMPSVKLPDFAPLQEFVRSGRPLSAGSLAGYNPGDSFLAQVIEWSKRSDDRYLKVTKEDGLPPFPPVRSILERASRQADIMIVSSSSHAALMQDWGETQLLPFISLIAGQEFGSKAAQLKFAVAGNYESHRTLMIGDALSDLEAAQANEVHFYPIIPGKELQSWESFLGEALQRFISENYAGHYEGQLIAGFRAALRPAPGMDA